MMYPSTTLKTLRRAILNLMGGLALSSTLMTAAHAVTTADGGSINRIQVGIEIPPGWNLGATPYLGTVSYSVTTAADLNNVMRTSYRIDGAINLADFVINQASMIATDLIINFVRDGVVYGNCTFDTAAGLGSPTPNLANYQLTVIQRDDGQIQPQIGTCKVSGNGTDFVAGIPDLKETDTLHLVSTNLSLISTLPAP